MSEMLSQLASRTGLRESEIRHIMLSAPERYKHYTIPKRDGTRREIAQPSREVKAVQRAFVDVYIAQLPVHEAATAYRIGLSIKDNALRHASNGPILKMDLKNFFPSIRMQDWHYYCEKNSFLETEHDRFLSGHLLFMRLPGRRALRLAIGAPSSPALSNVIMHDFDENIVEAIESNHVTYTRYADDMIFSAPRTGYLTGVQSAVARTIRELRFPRLEINSQKTTYITKKYHRTVTGLTLSNDGRVTIGRDRKRQISAMTHRFTLGELSKDSTKQLAGLLAFVNSAEPDFLEALCEKYGETAIARIMGQS